MAMIIKEKLHKYPFMFVMLSSFIFLLVGITIGMAYSAMDYQDRTIANRAYIDKQVEIAFKQVKDEKEADMELYEAIYFDKELGQTMYFFFRSDDNPFWRANEILEKEKIKFSNLRLRKSKLLKEEK
jgi:hypothetical protein